MQNDVRAYKKKWFEGKEYYDENSEEDLRANKSELLPKDKQSAIK